VVLTEEKFRLEFRRATESLTNRCAADDSARIARIKTILKERASAMTERGRRKVSYGDRRQRQMQKTVRVSMIRASPTDSTASRSPGPRRSRPTTSTAPRRATPCASWRRGPCRNGTLAGWLRLSKREIAWCSKNRQVKIADNSGARRALVIRVLGGSSAATRGSATLVVVTIKDAIPPAR